MDDLAKIDLVKLEQMLLDALAHLTQMKQKLAPPDLHPDPTPIPVEPEPVQASPAIPEQMQEPVTMRVLTLTKDVLDLIDAQVQVESGGNMYAIGDRGLPVTEKVPDPKAYGILQIRYGVLGDVNGLWKTNYKLTDLLGPSGAFLSKKICGQYYLAFVTQKTIGRVPVLEDYARAWNGGLGGAIHRPNPNPVVEQELQGYWGKVEAQLAKQKTI